MINNYVQCGDVGFKQNMFLKKIKIKDKNKKNFQLFKIAYDYDYK